MDLRVLGVFGFGISGLGCFGQGAEALILTCNPGAEFELLWVYPKASEPSS